MDFETYAMKGQRPKRSLEKSSHSYDEMSVDDHMAYCGGTMLNAATAFHKLHLKVNGQGSHAAHLALGELYEGIPGLMDAVLEGYQGAAEVIQMIPYSEVVNDLDNLKSLFNSVKYKLLFLK
jgi:hypothetical protein